MNDTLHLPAAPLSISNLTVQFGAVTALHDIDLTIPAGEFVTLLGPSGSGKSTLLMAIAGFVTPMRGEIRMGGGDLLGIPAERRNFGVVFQGYALFPHMTVAQNVAFPLQVRRISAGERAKRVRKALGLVRMEEFADRKPSQLSGGQQQRVAIARALVFGPSVVLLDEPLSALDRQLREEMQLELKELHKRVGCTFVMVTHDQGEALAMSDTIAVLESGRLLQTGRPRDVYARPASRFVAEFLGKSNLIAGRAVRSGDGCWLIDTAIGRFAHTGHGFPAADGEEILLAIRPESWFCPSASTANCNQVAGKIVAATFGGRSQEIQFHVDGLGTLSADCPTIKRFEIGAEIAFGWDSRNSIMIPKGAHA